MSTKNSNANLHSFRASVLSSWAVFRSRCWSVSRHLGTIPWHLVKDLSAEPASSVPQVICIDLVLQKHFKEARGAQARGPGPGLELDSDTQQSASHCIMENPEVVHIYYSKTSKGSVNICMPLGRESHAKSTPLWAISDSRTYITISWNLKLTTSWDSMLNSLCQLNRS